MPIKILIRGVYFYKGIISFLKRERDWTVRNGWLAVTSWNGHGTFISFTFIHASKTKESLLFNLNLDLIEDKIVIL